MTLLTKCYFILADPNVRVACLTCFGAVSAIQPPLMEVCHIIQPSRTTSLSLSSSTKDLPNPVTAIKTNDPVDSGFSSNQSPESGNLEAGNVSPGLSTPSPGISGTQTPVYADPLLQSQASQTSWLIKLCVKNITPQPRGFGENGEYYTEPLPVRLESLQVLAHLTKGYFPIIRFVLCGFRYKYFRMIFHISSWVPIFEDYGKLTGSWICIFIVLPKFACNIIAV